jgi:hypothetical protein
LTARRTTPRYTLEQLLVQCTPKNMALTEEDKAWLAMKPAGHEWGAE